MLNKHFFVLFVYVTCALANKIDVHNHISNAKGLHDILSVQPLFEFLFDEQMQLQILMITY